MPRLPPKPAASQRQRLLTVAEQLMSDRGIDAVSLRSVMAAAGANVASVHYHFGTKNELVEALVHTRSEELGARREPRLRALEQAGTPSARGLAEAFVLPVGELALAGEAAWVRFVHRVISERHPAFALLDETFAPQAQRIGALLRLGVPDLDPVSARFRLAESMTTTFRVLGDLDWVKRAIKPQGPVSDEAVVSQLLDLVTAVLEGPSDR